MRIERDDYSKLKITTHFCITDQNLFPGNEKFYSKYYFMDTVDHQIYSDKISIGVVQLNQIENATNTDRENNLVYWAKLINAETWEEFRALANGSPAIEEVGDLMMQINADNEKKTVLEAQRKYREVVASQYAAGVEDTEKKLKPLIEEKDITIAEQKKAIEKKDEAIEEKDKAIEEKDATIAKLQELLAKSGISKDV